MAGLVPAINIYGLISAGDEVRPPEALRIKQCGEIAVIDPGLGGRCDSRLGVIGDAQSCLLDHAEIVGAVADHQRIQIIQVERLAQINERRELRFTSQDRLRHAARQFAVLHQQFVSAVFLKADHFGNALGEQGEAT